MDVKFIQTAVSQANYDRISRCAFDEKLNLSDMLEKMALDYLSNKENPTQGGQSESVTRQA